MEILNRELEFSATNLREWVRAFVKDNPGLFGNPGLFRNNPEDNPKSEPVFFTENKLDNIAVDWLMKGEDVMGWLSILPITESKCDVKIISNQAHPEYKPVLEQLKSFILRPDIVHEINPGPQIEISEIQPESSLNDDELKLHKEAKALKITYYRLKRWYTIKALNGLTQAVLAERLDVSTETIKGDYRAMREKGFID